MTDFFAIRLFLQWYAERAVEINRGAIEAHFRNAGHLHAEIHVGLLDDDLGKDILLLEPHVQIAVLVYVLRVHSAEIFHARKHEHIEAGEEVVHFLSTERHLEPHDVADARLEIRDRLLRLPHGGVLARERREVPHHLGAHLVPEMRPAATLADADRYHYLFQFSVDVFHS